MNIRKVMKPVVVGLALSVTVTMAQASVIPLSFQTPLYPDTILNTAVSGTALSDLVLIYSYADKAEIQAQLDAGINQNGSGFTVLDTNLVYGPGAVSKPNQGAIILGSRLNVKGNYIPEQNMLFPPVLGGAAGQANIFVTLAYGQACNCTAIIELVTYSNYPESISKAFGMPVGSPVHIAFEKFKLGITEDHNKGIKTYEIDSKGVDGFSFHYKVKAPNGIPAVTVEDPLLDARNDPNSALLLFQGTSRNTRFVPKPGDLEMSVKKFPMPYGGYVNLNGVLNVRIVQDQALQTSKFSP